MRAAIVTGIFALIAAFVVAVVPDILIGVRNREPEDPFKMIPTVTASAQVSKHQDCEGDWFTYEPEKAIDGKDVTTWRVPGDGQGSWIELDYTRPVKVSTIGIIPGHDKINNVCDIDSFTSLHVVRQVSIEFSDGTDQSKQFDRNRSMQWVRLDRPKTTESVRIKIKDTYPQRPRRGNDEINETAISEIEIR